MATYSVIAPGVLADTVLASGVTKKEAIRVFLSAYDNPLFRDSNVKVINSATSEIMVTANTRWYNSKAFLPKLPRPFKNIPAPQGVE